MVRKENELKGSYIQVLDLTAESLHRAHQLPSEIAFRLRAEVLSSFEHLPSDSLVFVSAFGSHANLSSISLPSKEGIQFHPNDIPDLRLPFKKPTFEPPKTKNWTAPEQGGGAFKKPDPTEDDNEPF